MPGAGTDKTKRWIEQPAPVVVLVETPIGREYWGGGPRHGQFWPGPAAAG